MVRVGGLPEQARDRGCGLGGMVRVGPVHYNTLEEIYRFGEALGRIVNTSGQSRQGFLCIQLDRINP